jgi:hypothetical protein
MQKNLLVAALSIALTAPALASGVMANEEIPKASELLTGDTKLACEAILCLSSGTRPSECSPSLRRYFGINTKHTIRDRINFLNMCPTSKENGMGDLINAIGNGAGRCDAAALNKIGHYVGSREDRRFVVTTTKPSYCQAYENHQWVDKGLSSSVKLVPVYCPNPNYNAPSSRYGSVGRFNKKQEPKEIQCGSKWVDVKQ